MRIKDLFSSKLTFLGFLTNLGLITLTYVIFYALEYFISFEGLSFLNRLNIFSVIYLILAGTTYKWALDKNDSFKTGFIIAVIAIVLILMLIYLRTLF